MRWRGRVCERCFEWAACCEGLCQQCREEVRTGDVVFAPVAEQPGIRVSWCVVCFGDHDGPGELCAPCLAEISATTEPGWRERYVA